MLARSLVLAAALAACAKPSPGDTACTTGCDGKGDGSGSGSDILVWPNDTSRANSDPWLVTHHDQLREIHPQVLVLNFNNETTNDQVTTFVTENVFPALREGSRYHGYSDPAAPAFRIDQLAGVVDLTDHIPPVGWPNRNSTKLPVKTTVSASDQYTLDYSALYTQAFADEMAIADPDDPSHHMTMCELFDRGFVNEVWINVAHEVGQTMPIAAEEIDNTQEYDTSLGAIAGQFNRCGGNGCFAPADVPPCHVTVRFGGLAMDRGPGCKLHATGHAFEGLSNRVIPYLEDNFAHYGNFDLMSRLGAPFKSWYGECAGASQAQCITVTDTNSVAWTSKTGQTGTFSPFDQGCGNVHFPPNARWDYDIQNTAAILATCEHYGMHDGPDGKDLATLVSPATWAPLDGIAPDCGNGWNLYWRQNMPGLDNHATDAAGQPMKNWWPFLFY